MGQRTLKKGPGLRICIRYTNCVAFAARSLMYSKCYYSLNINSIYFLNTKFVTYFHGDQNRKEIHGIIQVAKFSSHVCKRKKSHTMIIPMNFFLSFWPMHICIIFSFLLLTQINWLISKRCCLRLSIVWLLRFFKSSFLHRLLFSFEYIISFLCWEHIKKVSWTFSFRNQKCISWIPIVLDFGRLKRWRLNWMHWKWYGCHDVLEFQTNKEFWDHFKLKCLNISLIFCIYQYFL